MRNFRRPWIFGYLRIYLKFIQKAEMAAAHDLEVGPFRADPLQVGMEMPPLNPGAKTIAENRPPLRPKRLWSSRLTTADPLLEMHRRVNAEPHPQDLQREGNTTLERGSAIGGHAGSARQADRESRPRIATSIVSIVRNLRARNSLLLWGLTHKPRRIIPHLRWWIGGLLFASTI